LKIAFVGLDGAVHRGTLVRGQNPVAVHARVGGRAARPMGRLERAKAEMLPMRFPRRNSSARGARALRCKLLT
jgi:hypothetical protein